MRLKSAPQSLLHIINAALNSVPIVDNLSTDIINVSVIMYFIYHVLLAHLPPVKWHLPPPSGRADFQGVTPRFRYHIVKRKELIVSFFFAKVTIAMVGAHFVVA